MSRYAALLAVILGLTVAVSALAQPFADVPTDHWAYDAIAELAAKGLIEGYPDGAFRGDRAMTRYEMAMVAKASAARASPSCRKRRVDPSMSVKRKVTVPVSEGGINSPSSGPGRVARSRSTRPAASL